jgi:transcriptional regulator GlxA family with amidase domain
MHMLPHRACGPAQSLADVARGHVPSNEIRQLPILLSRPASLWGSRSAPILASQPLGHSIRRGLRCLPSVAQRAGDAATAACASRALARACAEGARYSKVLFRPERILCESGYDRSHGQLPFAAMTRPRQHSDAVIADCQSWIAERYAEPNPVSRMVARAALPERTFKRRFRRATGYAAVDYVQVLRVEEAKQLLEATSKSVDSIAASVGYENAAFFRRLFKRLTGITPAQYRQRYQVMWQLEGKRS